MSLASQDLTKISEVIYAIAGRRDTPIGGHRYQGDTKPVVDRVLRVSHAIQLPRARVSISRDLSASIFDTNGSTVDR